MSDERNYDLKSETSGTVNAPDIHYKPSLPKSYRPRIGLIGCGGITKQHLTAYTRDKLDVVAMCDIHRPSAEARRDEYYPKADVTTKVEDILERKDIDVIDIAVHPKERLPLIEAALKAGKHVLSQKPFVLDLDDGERLADLADARGLKLAVNQNGRWAPYVRYTQACIQKSLLGSVQTVNMTLNWDHSWVKGTSFEKIHHLVLYDFAIHWFDMVNLFFDGQDAGDVYASLLSAADQPVKPPMIAQAGVAFSAGVATLSFDAFSRFGDGELLTVTGSKGTIRARGGVCSANDLTLYTENGSCRPQLEGEWMPDGFRGTMGELLCAIEEDREPSNSARSNLRSLALAFAAIRSAESGKPITCGTVRKASEGCFPNENL